MDLRVLLAAAVISSAGGSAWADPGCCRDQGGTGTCQGHHGHRGGSGCCQGHHDGCCAGTQQGVGPGTGGGAAYDPATVTTLRGTAGAVSNVSGGVHVTLQSDGRETDVHLGPAWFVEPAGLGIVQGDSLEVTGSLGESAQGAFLVAREVKKGAQSLTLRDEQGIPDWSGRRHP